MAPLKIAGTRFGSSGLTSFSTPSARLTCAWPDSTSFQGAVKCERRRGTTAFHVNHWHSLGKQAVLNERREADLAANAALAPSAHAAVAKPRLLNYFPRAARSAQAAVGQHV